MLLIGLSHLGCAIAADPATQENSQQQVAANPAAQNADQPPVAATQDKDKTVTLDTMEVTSASVGRGSKVEKMDVSTTVLTRAQIQASPELTLDQMLNQQMGVIIPNIPQNQTDPTGQTISMRGTAGGEKVLVMVDGVPINDGYFRTIDFSQIPKDTIEKVEIVRGGGGAALWGNLAMGGVINIITKAPEAGVGLKRVGLAYGNYNTEVGDAAGTVYSSDKIKSGLNLNTILSDGYNTSPKFDQTSPNVTATKSRTYNGLWSNYFTPGERSKYFLKIGGSALLDEGQTYSTAKNEWYKLDLRFGGKTKYSDSGSINTSGFYEYSQMQKANGSLINIGGGAPNLLNGQNVAAAGSISGQQESMNYGSYGASGYIEDKLPLKSWGSIDDIKLGVDARGVNTQDVNNLFGQIGKTNTSAQFATFGMYGQTVFEGVFAQGTYKPKGTALEVTLGVREDLWQAMNGLENQTYFKNPAVTSVKSGYNSQSPANQTFDQIDPRLGLKYSFDNGVSLRAAAYRNFAAPGMNQLYRTYASSSTASLGNTNLTPETSIGEEGGIDFKSDKVKVALTGYHSQISNYINATTVCGNGVGVAQLCSGPGVLQSFGLPSGSFTNVSQNLNIGTVGIVGGEAFAEWKARDNLTLSSGVILTDAQLNSFNAQTAAMNAAILKSGGTNPLLVTGRQLPNVPTMMLTMGGKWDIRHDLSFGWTIKAWPAYASSTTAVTNPYMNQAATTADAHISYKATQKIELYLNAQNINNASYIQTNSSSSSSAPTMGMPRMVLGGIKVSF